MKGKIYKIFSEDHNDIYIGSTGNNISDRLIKHKYNYEAYLKGKYHYVSSFDILKQGNYKIEVLKFVSYDTVQELRIKEGEIVQLYRGMDVFIVVNKYLPGRTQDQWVIDNRVKVNKQHNLHYHNNFETAEAL